MDTRYYISKKSSHEVWINKKLKKTSYSKNSFTWLKLVFPRRRSSVLQHVIDPILMSFIVPVKPIYWMLNCFYITKYLFKITTTIDLSYISVCTVCPGSLAQFVYCLFKKSCQFYTVCPRSLAHFLFCLSKTSCPFLYCLSKKSCSFFILFVQEVLTIFYTVCP